MYLDAACLRLCLIMQSWTGQIVTDAMNMETSYCDRAHLENVQKILLLLEGGLVRRPLPIGRLSIVRANEVSYWMEALL